MARTNSVLAAFPLDDAARGIVRGVLDAGTELICLPDLPQADRVAAIRDAGAMMAWNLKDFSADELAALSGIGLLQIMTAGVDFLPLSTLPAGVPVAANAGAYAAPMAEHALAMAMAAAKRIVLAHNEVAQGVFKQHRPNRMLAGGVCGILGYGGIGVATARLMRAIGMRVHAVNRTPRSDELLDWSGGAEQLDTLLAAADVLVIATPLTKATTGLIGARELGLMKPDAILINLARGEIIDEAALYAHLQANPGFTACLDAWWVEPVRHGEFRMDYPFLDLPNVIGSPHNSASSGKSLSIALGHALVNIRRVLDGQAPLHLITSDDLL